MHASFPHSLSFLLLCTTAYAQIQWNLESTTGPSPRHEHGIAFDSDRGVVVLFGGITDNNNNNSAFNDTWEWDGTSWTQRFPTNSPGARSGCRMVYDPTRQRTVLFGGRNSASDHTWEWDGSDWTNQTTAGNGPAGSVEDPGLAYDPVRQRTVMFGGALGNVPVDETWEWDGTQWTEHTPTNSPSSRWGHVMEFDPATQGVLLWGGTYTNDMWAWDGSDWTDLAASTPPAARYVHAMAMSPSGELLLFGGTNGPTTFGDTWKFNGTQWTALTPSQSPSPRMATQMVFDGWRNEYVIFGGWSLPFPGTNFGDTWTATAIPTFASFGSGCAGSAGVPALDALGGSLPVIGQTLQLEFQQLPNVATVVIGVLGLSDQASGATPLPFPLSGLGMPGCTQLVSADSTYFLLGTNGSLPWNLPVPGIPGIAGIPFFLQGFVIDPTANAFGATVTNAAKGVLGT